LPGSWAGSGTDGNRGVELEIETQNIGKKFDGKAALDDISLSLKSGEVLAVIGPSGSGKTTLLRLINLLDKPSNGRLLINGKNPAGLSSADVYELRTRMALVFQNPSLFQRTVEANVAYALRIRLVHPDRVRKQVSGALDAVGLKDLGHQFAPTLSAGEAQRASFARAIVFRPELLMLDEFTANLDPANVKMLESAVTEYNKKTGATIILATHNLFQAKRLAHRVVFLFNGRVVETAEKNKFFTEPEHELTKAFLSGELIC